MPHTLTGYAGFTSEEIMNVRKIARKNLVKRMGKRYNKHKPIRRK